MSEQMRTYQHKSVTEEKPQSSCLPEDSESLLSYLLKQ